MVLTIQALVVLALLKMDLTQVIHPLPAVTAGKEL
jgi:hypothetical protein